MIGLLILIPFITTISTVLAENIVEVELINPSPHTIIDPYEDIYVETYIHNCNESLCGNTFRLTYRFYDTENNYGIIDYSWPEFHGICLNYSCSHKMKLDAELIATHDNGFKLEVFVEPISYYNEAMDLSRAYPANEFYNQFGGVQLNYKFDNQFQCGSTYYNAQYVFENAYLNPRIWSFEKPEHNSIYSIGDDLPIHFVISGSLRNEYKTLEVFYFSVVEIYNGEETIIANYGFPNKTSNRYNGYQITIKETIFKPDRDYYLKSGYVSDYFEFTSGIFKISPSKNITIDPPIIENDKINITWGYEFDIESDHKDDLIDVQLMHRDQLFSEILVSSCEKMTIYDTTCQIGVPLHVNFVGGFYIKIGYYNKNGIYKQYYSDEFSINEFRSVLKGVYKSFPIRNIKTNYKLLTLEEETNNICHLDDSHSILKSDYNFVDDFKYEFVPSKYYGSTKIQLRYYVPLVGSINLGKNDIPERDYKQGLAYTLNFGVIEKTNIFQKFLRLKYKCKMFGFGCSTYDIDINILPYKTSFAFNYKNGEITENEIELYNKTLEYKSFNGSVHFGLKNSYIIVPVTINNLYVRYKWGEGLITKYDLDIDFSYNAGVYMKLLGEYSGEFSKNLLKFSNSKFLTIPVNGIPLTIGVEFGLDFNFNVEITGMFEYSIQYSKKYTYSLRVDSTKKNAKTKTLTDLTPSASLRGAYNGEINTLLVPSFDIDLNLTFGLAGYNPLKIPLTLKPGLDIVIDSRIPPFKYNNYYYYIIATPSYWLNFTIFKSEFELIAPTAIRSYLFLQAKQYHDYEIEFDLENNLYKNADEIEIEYLRQNFYDLIMWFKNNNTELTPSEYQSINHLNIKFEFDDDKLICKIVSQFELELEDIKLKFKELIDDRLRKSNKYKSMLEKNASGFNSLVERYANEGYKFYVVGYTFDNESSSSEIESSSQITTESSSSQIESSSSQIESSSQITTESSSSQIESSSQITTESSSSQIESSSQITTESSSQITTESSSSQIESSSQITTESSSQITTESSSQITTESNSQITTESNNEVDTGLIIGLTLGLTSLIVIVCIILILFFTYKHKKRGDTKYPSEYSFEIELSDNSYSIQIDSYSTEL